jgi:hypothetical protein
MAERLSANHPGGLDGLFVGHMVDGPSVIEPFGLLVPIMLQRTFRAAKYMSSDFVRFGDFAAALFTIR